MLGKYGGYNMIYLYKNDRVLTTDGWEQRHTTSIYDFTQDGWLAFELDHTPHKTAFIDGLYYPSVTTYELNKDAYAQELKDLQQWLNTHDYIINKHTLGEYADDDERWTTYLQDRQVKLARYNELEQLLTVDLTQGSAVEPVVIPEPIVEAVVEEVDQPTEDELLEEIIEDETA